MNKLSYKRSFDYESYWNLIRDLISQKKTTGENHSEEFLQYTQINMRRSERVDKTLVLNDSLITRLKNIQTAQTWLVITEWWCGDSSQSLPVIAKMATISPLIDLKIILRDENQDIIDLYLTNGGRSIPKLIAFRKDHEIPGEEIFIWGPRPEIVQQMYTDFKAQPGEKDIHAFHEQIHLWYAKDKQHSIQNEFEKINFG